MRTMNYALLLLVEQEKGFEFALNSEASAISNTVNVAIRTCVSVRTCSSNHPNRKGRIRRERWRNIVEDAGCDNTWLTFIQGVMLLLL